MYVVGYIEVSECGVRKACVQILRRRTKKNWRVAERSPVKTGEPFRARAVVRGLSVALLLPSDRCCSRLRPPPRRLHRRLLRRLARL
uniref:Uncharacterized protein n=1 Tax=Arundo donax TaxID=35708 RepID=A0A0A9HPL0_ARUDO